MRLIGIITGDNIIITEDGREFLLPIRGGDENGNPELLIYKTSSDGQRYSQRQNVKSLIGKKVEFTVSDKEVYGFDINVIV